MSVDYLAGFTWEKRHWSYKKCTTTIIAIYFVARCPSVTNRKQHILACEYTFAVVVVQLVCVIPVLPVCMWDSVCVHEWIPAVEAHNQYPTTLLCAPTHADQIKLTRLLFDRSTNYVQWYFLLIQRSEWLIECSEVVHINRFSRHFSFHLLSSTSLSSFRLNPHPSSLIQCT